MISRGRGLFNTHKKHQITIFPLLRSFRVFPLESETYKPRGLTPTCSPGQVIKRILPLKDSIFLY